jgi:hypothetical protein
METNCLHCWHSDPDKEKDSRWYCCHCPQEVYENQMDVRHCIGCHMRSLPNPWGFCVICAEVIDRWLEVQNVDHDPNLAACLTEYQETLMLENNRQTASRRHMGYRNRHNVLVSA